MSQANEAPQTAISVAGLSYQIANTQVLNNLSLDIPQGTIMALLGPSGCGKSTLLKMLAGLLQPNSGSIHFHQRKVADNRYCQPPEQRGLGMVFQDYALWPHMTVAQNVGFPLQVRGVSRQDRQPRIEQALERVGLSHLAQRKPADISGGQQQRVALARAIIAEPRILLFDEPLSNLDAPLRGSLSNEIGQLLRQLGTTAVYVTHDHNEALALAHRVAHMADGQISKITTL